MLERAESRAATTGTTLGRSIPCSFALPHLKTLARSLRAPAPADQIRWAEQDHAERREALVTKQAGFTLHAGRWVQAEDRDALERLCRHGLRAPFAQERLSRQDDGRVVYRLRRRWPHANGRTDLVMEPLELLRRLAALVPALGFQTIRYCGVFANRSKLRAQLPPPHQRSVAPSPFHKVHPDSQCG